MKGWMLAVSWVVIIAILIWIYIDEWKARKRRKVCMKEVIEQRQGRFFSGFWWMEGSAHLLIAGELAHLAYVSYGSRDREHFTCLTTKLPTPLGFQYSIHPEGIGDAIVKFVGGQDLEVGEQAFDRRFRVKAKNEDDEKTVKGLLDDTTRKCIQRLDSLKAEYMDPDYIEIELKDSVLHVKTRGRFEATSDLYLFLDLAETVAKRTIEMHQGNT